MARMQVDPKKMAVVKQTITTAAPTGGKTKGGVPLDPTEAMKFFDAEIARHEKLMDAANKNYYAGVDKNYAQTDPYGPAKKYVDTEPLKAKMDQVSKAGSFLREQRAALQNKLDKAKANREFVAKRKKEEAKQAAKPFLQRAGEKTKEIIEKLGSANNPVF